MSDAMPPILPYQRYGEPSDIPPRYDITIAKRPGEISVWATPLDESNPLFHLGSFMLLAAAVFGGIAFWYCLITEERDLVFSLRMLLIGAALGGAAVSLLILYRQTIRLTANREGIRISSPHTRWRNFAVPRAHISSVAIVFNLPVCSWDLVLVGPPVRIALIPGASRSELGRVCELLLDVLGIGTMPFAIAPPALPPPSTLGHDPEFPPVLDYSPGESAEDIAPRFQMKFTRNGDALEIIARPTGITWQTWLLVSLAGAVAFLLVGPALCLLGPLNLDSVLGGIIVGIGAAALGVWGYRMAVRPIHLIASPFGLHLLTDTSECTARFIPSGEIDRIIVQRIHGRRESVLLLYRGGAPIRLFPSGSAAELNQLAQELRLVLGVHPPVAA